MTAHLQIVLHQLRPALTEPLPAPPPLDGGEVQGEGARHRPVGGEGLEIGTSRIMHTCENIFQTCDGLY